MSGGPATSAKRGMMPSGPVAGGPMGGGPMGGGPMGGGPMGGGGKSDAVGPAILLGRPGINFVASIVLKKALADGIGTPTWPAGAAPAGGGGGMSMGAGVPMGPSKGKAD